MSLNGEALLCAVNAERIRRGLSWRDVARETGVLPSTLSRWQTGRGDPSIDAGLALLTWAGGLGPSSCRHDGRIMTGGVGTLSEPPVLRTFCLSCGQEVLW